jgi:putative proteasome-type protease
MKSNISVGPPINLVMYENDTFKVQHELRLERSAPYLRQIRSMWETSLNEAFNRMPDVNWGHELEGLKD